MEKHEIEALKSEYITNIIVNIQKSPPETVKKEVETILIGLVELIASQAPMLLKKGLNDNEVVKILLKSGGSILADGVMAAAMPGGADKMKEKFSKLISIFQMMGRYAGK